MRTLTQNTLVDIARHTNKTLKIADFMVKSNYPFLYNDMVSVDIGTSAVDAIEAFHKDIEKTATQMSQIHDLLSTVDDNDNVIHLKNDEKNLKKIFGDNYDPETKTISFETCSLSLKKPFHKDEFLSELIKNTLNLSFRDYRDMYKARKTIFKLDDQALYTDDDKISFLSIIKDREKYNDALTKIRNYGHGFGEYRSKLNLKDKNLIDNEITFNRSMIDSVTKNSTYITKENGIEQLARSHKKEQEEINTIVKFIKENDFINAVELDPETSLHGVINVLKQSKEIKFNLDNEVVFKVRKLGNYRANGLYLHSQKIVAVDIKNPSAAIHEFTHAVDYGRNDILYSQQRDDIARKYRQYMNLDALPLKQTDYYLRTDEIIARLGEVGFILNKYDFDDNQSIESFITKVQAFEKNDDPYLLNLAKPIDTYFKKNKNIYFNLEKPQDLKEVKEYYQSYFGVNNRDIKPINLIRVDQQKTKKTQRAKTQRHQIKPVSLFNANNIKYALDYNKKNKLISFDTLFEALCSNFTEVSRTVKKYDNNTLHDQRRTFAEMGQWVEEQNNPYLTYQGLKNLFPFNVPNSNIKSASILKNLIDNNYSLKASDMISLEKDTTDKLMQHISNYYKTNKSAHNPTLYENYIKSKRKLGDIYSKMMVEFVEKEKENFPEIREIQQLQNDATVITRDVKGRPKTRLKTNGISTIFKDLKESLQRCINTQKMDNVFYYSNSDDLLIYGTALNASNSHIIPFNLKEQQKDLFIKSLNEHGVLEKMAKNNAVYQKMLIDYEPKMGYTRIAKEGHTISPQLALAHTFNVSQDVVHNHLNDITFNQSGKTFVTYLEKFKENLETSKEKPKIIEPREENKQKEIKDFLTKKEGLDNKTQPKQTEKNKFNKKSQLNLF